jgi:hypothetical protein
MAVPACSVRQYQEVTVIVQRDEPLRGYATGGTISLGETPGDLTAAQINAALDGYGTWYDSPEYGRVWRPDTGLMSDRFAPYVTAGQWVPSTGGWYWQSDFAWGRVPFHYGRWVIDAGGWSWVPGSQFAPAWVDWRVGGGWVGWAALGPIGTRAWSPFVYCPGAGLTGAGLHRRIVHGPAGSSLYARTEPVPADGDTPRGPPTPAGVVAVPVARAWGGGATAPRPANTVASAIGIDTVERIPIAVVRALPQVVDPPVGGAAVIIRDRDVAHMSEGPSVRRPAGALAAELARAEPAAANAATATTTRVVATMLPPPPLPPPPDGVASSVPYGARAAYAPMGFVGRRVRPAVAGYAAPAVVVAPSQAVPAAPAAPTYSTGVTGAWFGAAANSRPAVNPTVGPIVSAQ